HFLGHKLGGTLEKVGDLFDDPKKDKVPATLTAEWLEMELHVPGQSPQKFERAIVDRIGVENRKEGKTPALKAENADERRLKHLLCAHYAIWVETGFLNSGAVNDLVVSRVLDRRRFFREMLKQRYAPTKDGAATLARRYYENLHRELPLELVTLS